MTLHVDSGSFPTKSAQALAARLLLLIDEDPGWPQTTPCRLRKNQEGMDFAVLSTSIRLCIGVG
jgi:hypothetical protein